MLLKRYCTVMFPHAIALFLYGSDSLSERDGSVGSFNSVEGFLLFCTKVICIYNLLRAPLDILKKPLEAKYNPDGETR